MLFGIQKGNSMFDRYVPVIWLSYYDDVPHRGYWDYGILEAIFARDIWHPVFPVEFVHYEDFEAIEETRFHTGVVIVPGRSHINDVERINNDIAKFRGVLVIVAGDEEGLFPTEKLNHPNMKLYVMTPHFEKDLSNVDRYIGEGWPQDARAFMRSNEKFASERPSGVNSISC